MNETAGDKNALQGVWKVDSITSKGQKVGYGVTHWEFDGNRVKEIIPYYVDGGAWGTFALDATTTPKHLDTIYEHETTRGETKAYTVKHAYELMGDTLRIGGALFNGVYPPTIDDTLSTVITLSRYTGPRPQTKTASGKKPVESPALGAVTWNDNQTVWDATVTFAPDQIVRVSLTPLEANADQTVSAGEMLVEWAKAHEAEIRAYATAQLADLAEEWREEEEEPDPITPEAFAARIRLTSISGESDGGASFWYDDDDIFAGHVIVVSTNAYREYTDAQIMG